MPLRIEVEHNEVKAPPHGDVFLDTSLMMIHVRNKLVMATIPPINIAGIIYIPVIISIIVML